MDLFESKLRSHLLRRGLLPPGTEVIAAVSGGPDSVALLTALSALSQPLSISIAGFHFNHRLRSESDEDEEFVRRLADGLGVPLAVERENTRAVAAREGRNIEETARLLRYRALSRAAGANVVAATGHTANDQAETLLMKLMRGAGPTGLAAIRERWHPSEADDDSMRLTLVRPLLAFRREEILEYLERQGRDYRVDRSNMDLRLHRNWVRHKLIPLIEERVNPSLVETLNRTGVLLGETADYLRESGRQALASCRSPEDPGRLLVSGLRDLPSILRREAVREALLRPAGIRLDYAHVQQVLDLIDSPDAGECILPQGWRAAREFDTLLIAPAETAPTPFSRAFSPPGRIDLEEVGKTLIAENADGNLSDDQGVFIPSGSEIRVRNRRPGDRYRTSSAAPEKKLKKILAERRVPRSERDRLLILEVGGRIAWVERIGGQRASGGQNGDGRTYRLSVVPSQAPGAGRAGG